MRVLRVLYEWLRAKVSSRPGQCAETRCCQMSGLEPRAIEGRDTVMSDECRMFYKNSTEFYGERLRAKVSSRPGQDTVLSDECRILYTSSTEFCGEWLRAKSLDTL